MAYIVPRLLLFIGLLISLIVGMANAHATAIEIPRKLEGHGGPIKAITIRSNGKQALSASFDYTVILWDLSELAEQKDRIIRRLIGHTAAVNDVEFLPNNRAVSVGDDGMIIIWDLHTGSITNKVETGPERILQLNISSDFKRLAIAKWDGTARIYSVDELKSVAVMEGHRSRVNTVSFSVDDQTLFTGAYDGSIREWDVKSGELIRPLYKHGWGINSIALTENGTSLVFGATQGTLGKISITDGGNVLQFAKFDRPVQSLAVSNDGLTIASGGGDGFIHLYEIATGKLKEEYVAAYDPIWDLAFLPGDKQMFHVGLDDFIIGWQLDPRAGFETVASQFPRRFQLVGSDDPGELEFQRKCSVCHTLEPDGKNRAGPTLYGLFGRQAGTVTGYPYSKALLESNIVWNEHTIGQLFDEGPDIVTPGTKMPIQRLKSVKRRDELIRFLKEATTVQ